MDARRAFYSSNPHKLSDATALYAYEREFAFSGFGVVNTVMVPCYSDVPRKENYAFRVGLRNRQGALMKSLKERLLARLMVTPSGCWEYTGSRDEDGYGKIMDVGMQLRAHCVS